MAEREVRDYELSLWTLQDSFITVLKPFGQEIKGQVQEGKLHISDDGTESLSFSIPMYLYQRDGNNGAVKVENPLWHNVINGILIANMRKIKLIFDKHGAREKVFEFIILKTTERHESDQLFCDVECEGLAFHELGKIGYKLELNADEFELDHKNWEESNKMEDEPIATLQYWNNKIFSNRRDWGYEVRMDYREEIGREGLSSEKVYEDRYVASWTVVDDQIQPTRWELGKEKARTTFDIKESNIYNITQEIAEAFGVFCKYEYEHDYNYHITKRTVVYYNNFLNEEAGVIDLTYPYNTNNITREMDSTDLITKMYVQSVDDELTDEGTVSITSVEANKMKEDYLLNFDYLYNIGTISQEQYDGIKEFEVEIRKLNEKFEKYSEIYSHRANQINSLEADIQNLKDAIVADNEELNTVNEQIRALGLSDGDGKASSVKIAPPNPNSQRTPFLSTKKNGKMAISLIAEHSKGINDPKSNIHVYAHYDSGTGKLSEEKAWKLYSNNKTGEIYELYNLPSKDKSGEIISTYYVSYTCTPSLQYKEIKDNFTKKLSQDTRRLNKLTKRYENIKKIYENAEKQIESLRTKKAKLILEFEHLMGSALREGYWNPENYNDYGNKYTGNIRLNRTTSSKHTTLDLGIRAQNIPVSDTSDRYLEFMWGNGKDSTGDELDIWADEQKSYYEEGVNLDKIYYPCIRISGPVLKKMIQNKENINLFSLLFYIGDETENQRKLEDINGWIGFNIGSQCQIGFRKGYLKGDKTRSYIFPVFVMTGLDDYTESTAMAVMSTTAYFAQTQELIDGEIQMEDIEAAAKKTTADDELLWWHDNDNVNGANRLTKKSQTSETGYVSLGKDFYPVPAYDLYYPRIIIKSQKLKKSSDGTEPDLTIKCGNSISGASSLQKLTDYEDYSIINSISEVEDTDEDALPYMYEAITIKPFSLLCYGSTTRNQNGTDIYCPMPILQIDYTISNADTAIYLDAIQVLKENSQPKVSYTIDLNNLGKELINTAYNLLGIVAHINDTDLKFSNIQGYVSEVEMDLDKPWEDSITIQNYKNKFEDLFSKIVAETAQMQKNSYTVGFAAQALTAGGGITGDVMQYTLANNTNLTYAFNNGRLTIDEVNGIIGESNDGIVAYRGGGIFTASEKDDEGNWIWNTGILPTGINASLITTGRLDTNQVNVYAGNDLRFVWNGEGLTAYKWNTDAMDLAIANGTDVPDDYAPAIDSKQYVRFNGEGIHLIAEPGATYTKRVLPKTFYFYLAYVYKDLSIDEHLVYKDEYWRYSGGYYRDPTEEEKQQFTDEIEELHRIIILDLDGYTDIMIPMPKKIVEIDWKADYDSDTDVITMEAFGYEYKMYKQDSDGYGLRIQISSSNKELYTYNGESNLLRVELNWNNFCFRDWDNQKVFYVNEDGQAELRVKRFSIGNKLTEISNNRIQIIQGAYDEVWLGELWSDSYFRVNNSGVLTAQNYNTFFTYNPSLKQPELQNFLFGFHMGKVDTETWIPDEINGHTGAGFWVAKNLVSTTVNEGLEDEYETPQWANLYGVILRDNSYVSETNMVLMLRANRIAIGSGAVIDGSSEIEIIHGGALRATTTAFIVDTSSKNISFTSNTNIVLNAASYMNLNAETYVNITANASNLASNAGTVGIHANLNSVLQAETGYITIKSNAPREGTYDWTENTVSIYSTNRAVYIRGYDIGFYMSHYAGSQSGGTGLRGARVRIVASNSKPSASNDYNILYLPTTGGNVQYIPLGGNG